MRIPHTPPPHGLSVPVVVQRVIDGDTLEVILPSGRSIHIRVEGFDAPEPTTTRGKVATQALENLLGPNEVLTAFVPLPEDKDKNGKLDLDELLKVLSFTRIRAYLFAGLVRIDAWMVAHGHVK